MGSHMQDHLQAVQFLYGKEAYVQIPNDLFQELADSIESSQQVAFAYSYLVLNAFLYKYASFVNADNNTYIQAKDIKQILGYGATTKSIDYIIKENGILESLQLTIAEKDFPVYHYYSEEEVDGMQMIDFIKRSQLADDDEYKNVIRKLVKNRNYKIAKPVFLFDYKDELGTLYQYDRTHRITIQEFIDIIYNDDLKTIGLFMYAYYKSKCYGYENNESRIRIHTIMQHTGVCRSTIYEYLEKLKQAQYIDVEHQGWRSNMSEKLESNKYRFIGVK